MDTNMWIVFDDSSNDEILEEFDDKLMVSYTIMVICANTREFNNPNELEDGSQGVVDHNHGVHGVHGVLWHMRMIYTSKF